jgi:hypothetical protein
MRVLLGLVLLVLALGAGALALTTAGPAFGGAPANAGQLRGVAFTLGMGAVAVALFWLALRAFSR